MTDRLSAEQWLDRGLKVLANDGFTALKAERLAKLMRVSRGSFYWHFADIGAFHTALLDRWRDLAAEQVIAGVERSSQGDDLLPALLRQAFRVRPRLEVAVRNWATFDATAQRAVHAIDRRRLSYIANLMETSGLSSDLAATRAQIVYWAFLGFALSESPLPQTKHAKMLDELIRIANQPA
jgi:AcrR family transcriptional regulator